MSDEIFQLKNEAEMDIIVKQFIASMPRNGGKNTKNQKWDGEVLDCRNYIIYNYIRQGLSRQRVIEEIANRWSVSMYTADKYYKEALESLVIENDAVADAARNLAIERLNKMTEDCIQQHRYDSALKALDLLNKINGLYTEKKEVEVTGLKFDFGDRKED